MKKTFKIMALAIVLLSLLVLVSCATVLGSLTDKVTDKAVDAVATELVNDTATPNAYSLMPYNEKIVSFEANGRFVVGTLCLPKNAKEGVEAVVMLHGTGSSRDEAGNGYKYCAMAMAANGIASLRIDMIGCGDSKVDYQYYNNETAVEDAIAAKEYLKTLDVINPKAIGVMGWSQGGTDALLAAAADPEFTSVVLWAGAMDLGILYTPEMKAEAEKNGFAVMNFDWRTPLNLGIDWIKQVEATDMNAVVQSIAAPILAINGEADTVVDPASGKQIAALSPNPISKNVIIANADHTFCVFTDSENLVALGETISETILWFKGTL